VVETGAPLVVDDVRRHPLLRSNLAARELGWVAYAGVPLVTGSGFAVGALSVIDAVPRLWSERDIALLQDLAAAAVTEIELHGLRGRAPAESAPRSGNGTSAPAGSFDAAGIPMGVVSAEGRWLRVNHALTDFLGYPEAELLGAPAERITHPADREADREALALLLAGECDSYSGEKRCLNRSAEVVWVLATVTAVASVGGRPRQLVGGFQDITDRKAAETALREREERYRLAAGAASDAVRDWNLATDRVTWGDGHEPVFGWPPPAAATAAWWYERIHPDDRERVVGAIQSALARGDRAWGLEYQFRRADGSWARVADRGRVVTENGEPVRLVGVMADVGERQEADEALRRSEARYRSWWTTCAKRCSDRFGRPLVLLTRRQD
jgi:PAS domain S-box-containing protein